MVLKSTARDRIVEAARSAFLADGYHSVSAQQIYRACGLSQGSFSFAFPGGRSELAAELWLDSHKVMWLAVLEPFALPGRRDPQVVLRAARIALVESVEADRAQARLYYDLVDALSWGAYAPRISDALASVDTHLSAWLDTVVADPAFLPPTCHARAILFGPVLEAGRAWAMGWSTELPHKLLLTLGNSPLFDRVEKRRANLP